MSSVGAPTAAKPTERERSTLSTLVRRYSGGPLQVLLAVVVGMVLWEALTFFGRDLIPGPAVVLSQALADAESGYLFLNAWASVYRVLAGFFIGSLLAVPLGFVIGWYRLPRLVIDPYLQFFRMIPPLAILPLAIILLGIGEETKIFVIFLAAFLSCVVATYQGVLNVDRTLINAARVLGASDRDLFWRVVVPASSPYILVGMRLGLGGAWTTVVAAELVAAQYGLGRMMQQAEMYYDMATIFVGLIAIGIIGLLMDRVFLVIDRRLTSWQERR
jgi:NitT/TauT family transport system permease protein